MIEARTVHVCTCEKCGREWIPLRCPECKAPGWNRKRKNNDVPVAPAEPIEMKPDTRVAELEEEELVPAAPVARQSPAKREPKVRPKVERTVSKTGRCAHGFFVLPDGTTACKRCTKIGA